MLKETREFDLNIEDILEDWDVHDALREIIANALDEQLLTQTADPGIYPDEEDRWHVRDYGRGLQYRHLTQNEDDEKLNNPHVIGKFGIGLKDALATLERKEKAVTINSPHMTVTLHRGAKHGFEDLHTLHAKISPPQDPTFAGTEFIMEGVEEVDVVRAKSLFLRFSGEREIETTQFGQVLERLDGAPASIYINGVKVAREDNFLFSYNITNLTKRIRKALNRERTNVGRTAYTPRVKQILLSCGCPEIATLLKDDLSGYSRGDLHDELQWIDVQLHAVKILNQQPVVFLTSQQIQDNPEMVDEIRAAGKEIVTVPDRRGGGTLPSSGLAS